MDAVGSGLRVVLRGKEAASALLRNGAVILPEQQTLLMRIRTVKDLNQGPMCWNRRSIRYVSLQSSFSCSFSVLISAFSF
mgnify:CR=1 FL=1